MVDDPNDQQQDNFDDNSGGGGGRGGFNFPGGGGGLLSFLPLLLGLFRGKGIIFLLVIGVGAYFLLGRGGCGKTVSSLFSQSGYNYDPQQFNKAAVYEGLEDDSRKNPLPEAVSLLRFAPQRLNQGQQGSCVAWSSAYAAHTILQAASTGQNPNSAPFSPAFLYNQIGLEGCQGSYIIRAMEYMSKQGSVPMNQFPYNPNDCSRQPGQDLVRQASQYKIHGFNRLTNGDNLQEISVRSVKEHLAKDAPVVIGMMVGNSFMQDMVGQEVWRPAAGDRNMMGFGGHAMCVIGYDDNKYGGAFQIMNSWGPEWGRDGVGWVRYGDFKTFVREAYGIDPLPKQGAAANIPLECAIGLVNTADKRYISLRNSGTNVFATQSPIRKGTKFKLEIKNATECYIYVFGQETDGSSYVLFPYTPKHSPYCGITGYRLFPRGQSMMADSIGNKDYMAIVVSKTELDYASLNSAINRSSQTGYANKVNDAVRSMAISPVRYNVTGGNIYFKADANNNKAVACVVEVDKN
jgi:hypothetical protein